MEQKFRKPEYIKTQNNYNCQQFFGPMTNCVFPAAGSTIQMPAQPAPSKEETPQVKESVAAKKSSGPRKRSFFRDEKGDKDENRTKQEAKRILGVIHKRKLGKELFDSSTTSSLNIIAAMFWLKWAEKGWVPAPTKSSYGAAFHRFLTEDCGLACPVEEKAFISSLRAIIKIGYIHYQEIYASVAKSFENN